MFYHISFRPFFVQSRLEDLNHETRETSNQELLLAGPPIQFCAPPGCRPPSVSSGLRREGKRCLPGRTRSFLHPSAQRICRDIAPLCLALVKQPGSDYHYDPGSAIIKPAPPQNSALSVSLYNKPEYPQKNFHEVSWRGSHQRYSAVPAYPKQEGRSPAPRDA